jgi:hypothetical protein
MVLSPLFGSGTSWNTSHPARLHPVAPLGRRTVAAGSETCPETVMALAPENAITSPNPFSKKSGVSTRIPGVPAKKYDSLSARTVSMCAVRSIAIGFNSR